MILPPTAWYPALKEFVQSDEIGQRTKRLVAARAHLAKSQLALLQLEQQRSKAEAALATARQVSEEKPDDEAAAEVAARLAEFGQIEQQLAAAQRELTVLALQQTHAAAEAAAIHARIAADKARFAEGAGDVEELARRAAQLEGEAHLSGERAKLAVAEKTLADHKSLTEPPAEEADRKAVKQAETDAATARKAIAEAEKAIADTPKQTEQAEYTLLGPQYPKTSTGRRAALAGWITSPVNPLTARVAANHIWMRHFGRPLVESVADFGRSGQQPSHPKLLDWLAVELMDHDPVSADPSEKQRPWAMKKIHRLIVTSNTYRLSSRPGSDAHPNFQKDKDNLYWWKFNRQRMQAETVRDSMLFLCGRLDPTIGGQEVAADQEAESLRRSMYFAIYPEAGGAMPFMTLFDPPNPTDCYRRSETVVPQQALAMANSAVALNQGRQLADTLSKLVSIDSDLSVSDGSFIVASFEQILCRQPTAQELRVCHQFLSKQRELYERVGSERLETEPPQGLTPAASDPVQRSRQSLVRTLLNHNDFVTIH